jgi:hypothetical protein
MASVAALHESTGAWMGRSSLWLQPGTDPSESASSAIVGTVAGGKIVSVDYTWEHEGTAQDGRILVAAGELDGVHMSWCDSFHMDTKIMELTGDGRAAAVAATGSWQVEGSEPWGWRIELEPRGRDALQMRMYNILPAGMGGAEMLAVQADYTRA